MATAWAAPLQGHVALRGDDGHTLMEAMPNYEWVELRLGCCPIEAEARAVSLVWRALAACRGFGIDERPEFWKRVFDLLARRPATTNNECRGSKSHVWVNSSLSNELRFFEGVAVPRFKVEMYAHLGMDDVERVLRGYCGLPVGTTTMDDRSGTAHSDSQAKSILQVELESTLARLTPLVRWDHRLGKPVELTLHVNVTQSDEPRYHRDACQYHQVDQWGHKADSYSPTIPPRGPRHGALSMCTEDGQQY